MAALLRHFTHEHPLRVVSYDGDFICDGCHTLGAGERYHCSQYCQFDLHMECAVSSTNISSHLHRLDHRLNLVWDKPEDAAAFSGHRPCNVCEEQVNGLYFACPDLLCNFVLHPICSNVPESVRHVTDRKHPLTFQYAMESKCKICMRNCTGWRYRCGPCRTDIHLECLLSPPPPPPPATNLRDDYLIRTQSFGQSQDRRPLDHQYYPPQQAAGINSVGMQSSSSSPSLYALHHSHSFNYSQHNPYPSSPSYASGASSQQHLQPLINNNHGSSHHGSPGGSQSGSSHHGSPDKPDGSSHHGSPGGSQSGSKRKKMYAIVGQLLAVVATHAILGLAM